MYTASGPSKRTVSNSRLTTPYEKTLANHESKNNN